MVVGVERNRHFGTRDIENLTGQAMNVAYLRDEL
jgi:hypothetical protein